MIKRITVERDFIFCDKCGKKLDPEDAAYHDNVWEVYGSDGDYCKACADLAWSCYGCDKTFFSDTDYEPINIEGNDYCIDCAKHYVAAILDEIKEKEK